VDKIDTSNKFTNKNNNSGQIIVHVTPLFDLFAHIALRNFDHDSSLDRVPYPTAGKDGRN
jgi:hypothetical protein